METLLTEKNETYVH